MKIKNPSDFIIAGIVVTCSLGLLAAMSIALTGFSLGGTSKTVYVDMPSASGIRINSEVRYAGAKVGRIVSIKTLPWKERGRSDLAIRVTAQIDESMPPLKTDSAASLDSDTILADKFLNLSPGTEAAPDLPEGQPVYAARTVTFDDLTREGMATLTQINEMISNIREKNPHLAMQINELVTNADQLVASLNTAISSNREQLEKTLRDLHVTMENLKVTSTYTKALTGTLGEKPWRLIWGGPTPTLPSEEEILSSDQPIVIQLPKK